MRLILLSFFFMGTHFLTKAQDTAPIEQDSLNWESVLYTSYYSQSLAASGTYVKVVQDSNLFKFSSGVSVFNVLRGQVPGLVISPFAVLGVPGFRYEYYSQKSASVLLDGIPFNASITDYLNFNASEFSEVTVVPSPNALSFLDLPTTGAVILTSKNGKGITKPTFECHSNLLMGWAERGSRSGTFTEKDWNLYNSLSYAQDFGKLDIRLSYGAINRWPSDRFIRPEYPMSHFLKFNAGYKLGNRGEIRAVLSATLRKQNETTITEEITNPFPIPADTAYTALNQQFVTANLTAGYRLTDWLRLTGQLSVSAHDSTYTGESTQSSVSRQRKDGQAQVNTYAVVNKSFGSSLEVSGFAGLQYATMKLSLDDFTGNGEQNFDLSYLSTGTSVGFRKYMFTNLLLKVPLSENDKINYSVSGSFVFSELFKSIPISSGKIRYSFGRNNFTDYSSYPWQRSTFIVSRPIRPVASMELGGDFSFLDERLLVSLTHFNDKWAVDLPGISELQRKGFEGDISYLLIRKARANLKTGAVFSFFGDGDFRGSLLAQLTRGKSFISIMAERVSITLLADSQSFTRLRDITIGQSIGAGLLSKTWLSHLNLGISVRNIYDFTSSRNADYENQNFDFVKSVNINISMVFR